MNEAILVGFIKWLHQRGFELAEGGYYWNDATQNSDWQLHSADLDSTALEKLAREFIDEGCPIDN